MPVLNALVAVKVVGVLAGLTLASTGAAAATGKLPDPVQSVASTSASHVGVNLPDPKELVTAKAEDDSPSSSTTTSTALPTVVPSTAPVPVPGSTPPSPSISPPTTCVHEVGDGSCAHGDESEHAQGTKTIESGKHQTGKGDAGPTTTIKKGEDGSHTEASGGAKKTSPSSTSVPQSTSTTSERHQSKNNGSDD